MVGGNGATVLVVDDDREVRGVLRGILARAGLGCVEASDGESALRLAAECGPSAAVVDLVLPGMSGAEFAWRLREVLPGLRVVGVSGHLDLWDADDLEDLGIREVLPKPFRAERLMQAVGRALAHTKEVHRGAC